MKENQSKKWEEKYSDLVLENINEEDCCDEEFLEEYDYELEDVNEENLEDMKEEFATMKVSRYYYQDGVMSGVLSAMQEGINQASEIYKKTKKSYTNPKIEIHLDENHYKLSFLVGEFNKETYSISNEVEILNYSVGEPMEEALYILNIMDELGRSTSLGHAINNWIEDLNWQEFGIWGIDFSCSDSWGHLEN